MVKIEQTGGRLTEEEILHGKEDAYGIYQVNRMVCSLLGRQLKK